MTIESILRIIYIIVLIISIIVNICLFMLIKKKSSKTVDEAFNEIKELVPKFLSSIGINSAEDGIKLISQIKDLFGKSS